MNDKSDCQIVTICNCLANRAHFLNEIVYLQMYNHNGIGDIMMPLWAKNSNTDFCEHLENNGCRFKYVMINDQFKWKNTYVKGKINIFNERHSPYTLNRFFTNDSIPCIYYISRKGNNLRSIINDDVLFTKLEKKLAEVTHVPIIYLNLENKNMSLLENAQMFANARGIISIHGQVLGNIVCMESKTKVLEIFPYNFEKPTFRYLSYLCGHYYKRYIVSQGSTKLSDKGVSFPKDSFITLTNTEIDEIVNMYVSLFK